MHCKNPQTMMPKSLHTVTALINVARHLNPAPTPAECALLAQRAAAILGYDLVDDTYGLIARAAAALQK